jgi:hypothetical protein
MCILHSHSRSSQVVYSVEACAKAIRNPRAFNNTFLAKIMKSDSPAGARCLQFISVVIFFQMLGLRFAKKEEFLQNRVKDLIRISIVAHGKSDLEDVLKHYRRNVFSSFFSKTITGDNLIAAFQDTFGYTLFVKWLVQSCGHSFTLFKDKRVSNKGPRDGPENKRKIPSDDRQAKRTRKTTAEVDAITTKMTKSVPGVARKTTAAVVAIPTKTTKLVPVVARNNVAAEPYVFGQRNQDFDWERFQESVSIYSGSCHSLS